ncbi:VapA/VapB family virulence-associated protein [Flavobacterium sp.]|uniref:VapA/VapB family virulence-associated protein n=1 Tax=Flavobacterium sp. TaxID=239 RepID=UPI004048C2F2
METNINSIEAENLKMMTTDFKEVVKGKMEEKQIEKIVSDMSSFTNRHAAQCPISSAVFYVWINVIVEGGKSAVGHGGGLFTPGGGGSWGHLYTNDIERLYRDTISFQVNAAQVYLNVNFFDAHSNLLGSYHGGGIGTVRGIGGGTTKWT